MASASSTKPFQRLDGTDISHVHGFLGDSSWPRPRLVVKCDEDARSGYDTRKAHEFLDEPEVLAAKVRLVADLITRSRRFVLYTGAGISTMAGIGDYASRAAGSRSTVAQQQHKKGLKRTGLGARPTLSHRVLAAMCRAGHVWRWVQQNHDGLPQKAGTPQSVMNEIHGAWFDPSNPVVKMSGDLRGDLFSDLLDVETSADLTIAAGTSLAGMNADRVVETVGKKALRKKGTALGAVILGLQQTRLDHISAVRVFCLLDDFFGMLAKEMNLRVIREHKYTLREYAMLAAAPTSTTKAPGSGGGGGASGASASASGAGSRADPVVSPPAGAASAAAAAAEGVATLSMGNLHELVIPEGPAGDGNKHRWTAFVRAASVPAELGVHPDAAIEQVTFTLHPTFAKPVVVVKSAPFQLSRIGWGTFDIGVTVEFNPTLGLPPINGTISLSFEGSGASSTVDIPVRLPSASDGAAVAAAAGAGDGAGAGASSAATDAAAAAGGDASGRAPALRLASAKTLLTELASVVGTVPGFTNTRHVYMVPYDEEGNRLPEGAPRRRLDLREGKALMLTGGPYSSSPVTVSTAPDEDDARYVVMVRNSKGLRMPMALGLWWIGAALVGALPTIPVVSK